MRQNNMVVMLLMFVCAISVITGCNDQQSPPPAQQAPAATTVLTPQTPIPTRPQAANQPQAATVVEQPRLAWVSPVKWATTKGVQLSFVALEDMLATNWAVVLDNSGSMKTTQCSGNDSRMVAGGKAVISFARQRPDKDNFALVLFTNSNPYARVAMPLGRDRSVFNQEVQGARPDFNTPLAPAIELAYGELFAQGKRQNWHGAYHIVVVTDGEYNEGGDPRPIIRRIIDGSPVQVHTVGFCTGSNHSLNIAGYTTYASADNAAQLNAGLQAVLKAESETFVDPDLIK